MKPWLVIPCYDHGTALAGVVATLARYDLPAIVVDDGSGPETRAILAELAAAQPWLTVHRHSDRRSSPVKVSVAVPAVQANAPWSLNSPG